MRIDAKPAVRAYTVKTVLGNPYGEAIIRENTRSDIFSDGAECVKSRNSVFEQPAVGTDCLNRGRELPISKRYRGSETKFLLKKEKEL